MYQKYFKNILDFNLAFFILFILSPIILIIYLYLFYLIGSPIFYQKRGGYKNKVFTLLKFKTLIDKECHNFNGKKRLFKFGSFLRITGLDELPQLFNILKGDISFVGPRPLIKKYLKIKEFRRHPRSKCKPGITGLAQISNISQRSKWKMQFRLDKEYYINLSFFLDFKITLKTFVKIFNSSKKDFHQEPRLVKNDLI